jgi:hypothetical protein
LLVSSRRIAGDGGTLPGRYVLADKTDLLDNVLALRQNMAIKELYVVIRNDGEVAVIIPFANDRCVFDYQRAYTQRPGGNDREQFREKFPLTEDAKAEVLNKLGISEGELKAAVRHARSDSAKCQNLRQLVQAGRKTMKAGLH